MTGRNHVRLDRHRLRAPRTFMAEVPRPHLEDLARRAMAHALVLVQADAGYGKTAFARLCAAHHPSAWYCLDPSDNDPQRFTAHLAASLRQLLSGAQWSTPHGTWIDTMDDLLERLEQGLPEQALLILDDLQVLTDGQTIAAVAYFLERLPAPLTAVLTSQTLPPLPDLHRWQAQGRLYTVGRDNLRFMRTEVDAFFATRYGQRLSADRATHVHSLCEGWPIAMHLLGSAMTDEQTIDTGGGDHVDLDAVDRKRIADYLRQHVLARHDEATCRFLLMTALVDDFNQGLADDLLGVSTAELLARVRDSGLYLTSDGHGSYTYQGWFRDFLRSEVDATTRADVHQRAASHFQAHGRVEDAVSQFLAAGSLEAASALLEDLAPDLTSRGEHIRVMTLTDPLPPAIRTHHPQVQLARADALRLASRFEEAEAEACMAVEFADAEHRASAQFAALERLVQIHLDTVRPAKATKPLASMESLLPLLGYRERIRWQRLAAENQLNAGDLDLAATALEDVNADDALSARLATRKGDLPEAITHIRPLAQGGMNRSPRSHREQHALMAWVLALQGNSESAEREALKGIETGRVLASPIIECLCTGRAGLALLSRANADATELGSATDLLQRCLQLADAIRLPRFRAEALIGLTVACGRSSDWGGARQHGVEAIAILNDAGDAYLTGLAELALGVAAITTNHPEAERWLQAALRSSERIGERYVRTLTQLWLAHRHRLAGNEHEATAVATVALATMRDHALDCLLTTSPWLGFPKPADRQQLIELAAANEELARYARYLVDTNSGGDIDLPHASGPWGLRVRLLGDFAVHVDGAPVPDTAWRRRKGRELFWLLCVHPKHSITRGEAADALWPEGNVDASSVRFRVALHSLREAIEPDRSAWGTRFVHSNDERIWLDPLVAVDVDDFRAAATAAPNDPTANAAERAADLYTGVLLPSGGAIDWLEPWRQELSRSWAGLALSAAEQALEQRRPGSAVPLLRSVIAEQPYEENAYRLLAAALAQTGQPGAARSVFRDCQRRLRDELALEPSWCLSDIGL